MIGEKLHIRRYERGDREAVWRLHDVAMREAGIHLGEGPWYDDLHDIEGNYLRDGGEFLVGTLDDEVVAIGALKKTGADRAEIKYMRVTPHLQRCGFGQTILTVLESRAAELGYETLHLDTAVQQRAARRLYESNGYREVGRDKKGDLDCVFYEKRAPLSEGRHSYEAAGVSIERGDRAVALMRSAVERTHGPEVVGASGGFAGLYALSGMSDPVLASTIDGIGTKTMVARGVGRYGTLGADIVNHCANDVLATGAQPLIFLDYAASGRLVPEAIADVVRGAAEACESIGVALIGGETAEMPGMYGEGDLEIVGACIGACERTEVVTGEKVRAGDAVIGLASSGLHTNGYTLARKVLEDAGVSYSDAPEPLDRTVGEAYLEPHRAYIREIEVLREAVEVRGMAHITGGGLPGNLPRALDGLGARLDASAWQEPAVFDLIRTLCNVPEGEMRRVFNLGVGFCAVVPAEQANKALDVLDNASCEAWHIGEVVTEPGGDVAFA